MVSVRVLLKGSEDSKVDSVSIDAPLALNTKMVVLA